MLPRGFLLFLGIAQTPAGGWSKGFDATDHLRGLGEGFSAGNTSRRPGCAGGRRENRRGVAPRRRARTRVRSGRAMPKRRVAADVSLDGGYHDSITLNDGAVSNIPTLLRDVAGGRPEFAFLSGERRAQAAASAEQGLACLLQCQVKVGARLTAWAQQYDMLTLAPTSARNYEMPAL